MHRSMRPLPLLLLSALAGCAGHVADFVGPRADIIAPQLPRYGLDLRQTRCVSEALGSRLKPLPLRLFARAAGAVTQGYFDPDRLTIRDLMHVAATMEDPEVGQALIGAALACGAAPAPEAPVPAEAPAPEPRPPAWLNLGAAPTGQSMAIDASTIEQKGAFRTAWFRMTDPGAPGPSADSYLLSVDCVNRAINPKARRRQDEGGAILETVDYPDNPLPVEEGTVMEIAWLALCT